MKDKDKRQMKWTAPAGTIEDNNKTNFECCLTRLSRANLAGFHLSNPNLQWVEEAVHIVSHAHAVPKHLNK